MFVAFIAGHDQSHGFRDQALTALAEYTPPPQEVVSPPFDRDSLPLGVLINVYALYPDDSDVDPHHVVASILRGVYNSDLLYAKGDSLQQVCDQIVSNLRLAARQGTSWGDPVRPLYPTRWEHLNDEVLSCLV